MALVANSDLKDNIHYWAKNDYGRRAGDAALALAYGRQTAAQGPVLRSATVEGDAMRVTFSYAEAGLTAAKWVVDKPVSCDFACEWEALAPYAVGTDDIVVKRISRGSDKSGTTCDNWRAHVRKLNDTEPIVGFAIAGGDGKLFPAVARIEGNTVVVSNAVKVPVPKFVAYGLTESGNYYNWNLYSRNGLPAVPFWSGTWPPSLTPQTTAAAVAPRSARRAHGVASSPARPVFLTVTGRAIEPGVSPRRAAGVYLVDHRHILEATVGLVR